MSFTPPLAQPAPAHIPLSSFPAASSPSAQGVASPFSFSPTGTPVSSRPPSPSQQYPPPGFLRDGSYSTTNSRATSRSKDPLVKKSRAYPGRRTVYDPRSWFTRSVDHGEETRGRPGVLVEESEVSAAPKTSRWKITKTRAQLILAFSMIGLVGMNDSATGANLSAMQAYYNVTYDEISIVFLSNVAGYFVSCVSSSFITHALGLRWSLFLAAFHMAAGCLVLSLAPSYGVFIFSLSLLGFGGGLYDSALTTVISHEEDGVLMSCMYACFGVGATFSPLIIGSFIDHGLGWNKYYYMPLGITVLLAIAAFPVFAGYESPPDEVHHTHAVEAAANAGEGEVVHARARISSVTRMHRALKLRAVWAGFLLIVLAFGTSDTLSAWIVSFMIEKRHSAEGVSRYQLSGLWAGIALGRVALAYYGRKMGEKSFSITMLACASSCLGIIWGVKNVPADAVALVGAGFFLGPVTPKVLSTVSARVPTSLKSSVMSLTIGLGLIGSSLGPLLFGVVAQKGWLGSLPGVLIGASVIGMGAWMLVPKNTRRED